MTKASELWHYFDETAGQWAGPVSRNTLDRMVADGAISKETATVSATMARRGGPNPPSIPYSQLASIPIEFDPPADDFLLAREDHFVTVLAGPNNCGKTLYLRQILAQLDHEAYLL